MPEYGSGGSTVYLHRMLLDKAERGSQALAPQVLVAVESDLSWFVNVIRQIGSHVADTASGRDGALEEQLTVRP